MTFVMVLTRAAALMDSKPTMDGILFVLPHLCLSESFSMLANFGLNIRSRVLGPLIFKSC